MIGIKTGGNDGRVTHENTSQRDDVSSYITLNWVGEAQQENITAYTSRGKTNSGHTLLANAYNVRRVHPSTQPIHQTT